MNVWNQDQKSQLVKLDFLEENEAVALIMALMLLVSTCFTGDVWSDQTDVVARRLLLGRTSSSLLLSLLLLRLVLALALAQQHPHQPCCPLDDPHLPSQFRIKNAFLAVDSEWQMMCCAVLEMA